MSEEELRELTVFGEKTFKIKVSKDSKITFSPWSPGDKYGNSGKNTGTLRIYEKGEKSTVLAMFSGVTSFRDTELDYMEQVTIEQGATVWHSDQNGYSREDKSSSERQWVDPKDEHIALPEPESIESLGQRLDLLKQIKQMESA